MTETEGKTRTEFGSDPEFDVEKYVALWLSDSWIPMDDFSEPQLDTLLSHVESLCEAFFQKYGLDFKIQNGYYSKLSYLRQILDETYVGSFGERPTRQ